MTITHELNVRTSDENDLRWRVANGACSCGWMVGCRTKDAVEKEFAIHVAEEDAKRFIVTVEGKEHVVRREQIRKVT